MEVRDGFLHTEVGIIPKEWDVKSLNEICIKIQDGTHFSPKKNGNDYLYITSKNIRSGYLDISTAGKISVEEHNKIYKRCNVQKGDLLITKDGANTGNAAINTLYEEISLLSSVAFLRFDSNYHSAEYYLQQILSIPGQQRIQEVMSGNAITRLTLEKINKLLFPIPTIKEQTVIANALADADALISGLEKLIAKKRDIKQGAMQELLTGKKRLPGFTGEWEEERLGDIVRINMGQSPNSENYNQERKGIPLIQGNADIEGRRSIERVWTTQITKTCSKGDILLTVRAPVGSIGIATEYSCLGRGVCSLECKNNIVEFLFQTLILNEEKWKILEQGSTFTAANSAQIKTFSIYIPPTIEEQSAIAQILSDMDAEISALESKLSKYRAIKQGMMQELLTGKTRLI